jgi:CHAT domain-containing protein/tetratricopeptide (TPR) repeat protein
VRRSYAPALALPLLAAAVAGWAACGRMPSGSGARSDREARLRKLAPGRPESFPAGGPRRLFQVSLRPGQLLHVAVEQRGADVALDLRDPAGRRLLAVDNPNGEWSFEDLYHVAATGGSYRLGLKVLSAAHGGRSILLLDAPRPPSPRDRRRALACRAASEGDAALARGDAAGRAEALRRYERSLGAWRSAGEPDHQAWTEMKIGRAWSEMGEPARSAEHWRRALGILRRAGPTLGDAIVENDLGAAYQRLGDLARARAACESALASARRVGDRREEVSATHTLGSLEQSAGEPWRAFLLLDEALAGWRELGDRSGEAATLHDMGRLYAVLGKLPEAREVLERSLALHRAMGERRGEAGASLELGWVRFLAGDPRAARAELSRALALWQATGDRRGEGVALDRLGSLSRELGEARRATGEYGRALAIFRVLGDRQSEAHTLSNLGQALAAAGDAAGGLRSEDEALRLLAGLGEPSAEAYARFRRARAERTLGRLAAAREDMEEGVRRLESIRDRAESEDLRMSYLDSVHDQYEDLIDLLMDLHAREPAAGFDAEALAMAERSRARGLLDLVSGARRRGEATAGSAGDRLRRLAAEIRALEARRRTGGPPDAAASAAAEESLRQRVAERQAILVELQRSSAAARPPPRLLAPREIRAQVLDGRTVLLVYSLGDRRSFVWAVTRQGIESAVLPPRAALEGAALRWHDLAARSDERGAATQERLTARELTALLLGPVAHALAGRRLAFVADGALAYVPFASLPEPGGDRYLLSGHEVEVLPSASVLAAVRARAAARPPAPREVAVLADPLFRPPPGSPGSAAPGHEVAAAELAAKAAASAAAATRSARDLGLAELAPLPFSREEERAILSLVPPGEGLGATGAAASRELATGGLLRRYRTVHFATHAFIHPTAPELSGVVLSLFDARGRPQPGFLRSYEIAELDLPAELVVLSACRTGLGQQLRGEGLVGLTQSFFEAGATRVVVSLWDVDDRATARLMERFYRELLVARRPPGEALRAAQLALRRDPRFSAPYFWAGFELQGDWRGFLGKE